MIPYILPTNSVANIAARRGRGSFFPQRLRLFTASLFSPLPHQEDGNASSSDLHSVGMNAVFGIGVSRVRGFDAVGDECFQR